MTEVVAAGTAVILMVVAMTYSQFTRTVVQLRNVWDDMAQLLDRRHTLVHGTVESADSWVDVPEAVVAALAHAHRDAITASTAPERIAAEDALDAAIALMRQHISDAALVSDDAAAHTSRLDAASQQIATAQRAGAQHAANYRRLVRTFPGNKLERMRGLQPHEHAALDDPRAAAMHPAPTRE